MDAGLHSDLCPGALRFDPAFARSLAGHERAVRGDCILLYRLIGRIFAPALGAIAALFWVFDHHVFATLYQNGLESGIASFFLILLIYKLYDFELSWRREQISKKQIITLAVIATLMMFSRLD